MWRADLVDHEGAVADPAEIESLKDQIRKYERAKERLEDAYYFSDDGMSEKNIWKRKIGLIPARGCRKQIERTNRNAYRFRC